MVVGDRAGTVVPDAVVDVADGLIRWVGAAADAPAAAADGNGVELPGILVPGLVNTHSHAPMALFRGQGEGLPLDRWLREVMWPREARLTADDVEVAMTAASAEMLGNGITTSVEMYFHPERIAAAVRASGARAVIATPLIPLPGMPPVEEQLRTAVELAAGVPADGRIEYGIGPHAAYTVPLPVLAPPLIILLGYGITPKIFLVALIGFFPIVVNTVDGLRGVDRELLDLLRTFGATRRQIFAKVRWPAALPFFFSGLRVAAPFSVIGAVFGELIGASAGLGYYIRQQTPYFHTAEVYGATLILALLGIGFFLLIRGLEWLALPWLRARGGGRRA